MWPTTKAITWAKKLDIQDENSEDTLPDCPFPSSQALRITGEAKHLVEERIHWEPPAIAGNFIVE